MDVRRGDPLTEVIDHMQQFLSAMQFSISVQQFYDFFQQLCNQIPLNIATKKHVSGSNMWLYTQGLHTVLLSGGTKKMRNESILRFKAYQSGNFLVLSPSPTCLPLRRKR